MTTGWQRSRRVLAVAAPLVTSLGIATAVVQPHLGSPGACTSADVVATTDGVTTQEISSTTNGVTTSSPTVDSLDLILRTRHRCTLQGPLRLQSRSAPNPWADIKQDPRPARTSGWSSEGAHGPQTAAGIDMDPSTTYDVDIVWFAAPAKCPAADMRVVGPDLVVPMQTLPEWCGQPASVSNTFPGSVSVSVAWRFVRTSGTDLVIDYMPQCRGATTRVTETAGSVKVATLTALPAGQATCLKMGYDPIQAHVKLRQPLGNRTLVHAPVGRWPALNW